MTAIFLLPGGASADSPGAWSWPLDQPSVEARFAPPADRYGAGHRGIDLSADVGDSVRAVAAGRVAFAGDVGGVPVITIDHGGERSTYQPVRARVRAGDAVVAREVIGTLLGAHSHCPRTCLHLGRRAGEDYRDPLELLAQARFVLVDPHGPPPIPPTGSGGALHRPVGGPITSPFGLRVHPVTGVREPHDGTDFGVACGTPVHAAGSGLVTARASGGPADYA
ncbi:peptidoglycan DD-metalloendopeptidase family protein [Aeromicrobium sp. UC242_57]|uniref:peptidoglycan DD-metalloendopeptidase family protein n=1 Tax=Aeromicrobium sp. UC242_57 TaxID=3374624 RepID=UPI0037C0A804